MSVAFEQPAREGLPGECDEPRMYFSPQYYPIASALYLTVDAKKPQSCAAEDVKFRVTSVLALSEILRCSHVYLAKSSERPQEVVLGSVGSCLGRGPNVPCIPAADGISRCSRAPFAVTDWLNRVAMNARPMNEQLRGLPRELLEVGLSEQPCVADGTENINFSHPCTAGPCTGQDQALCSGVRPGAGAWHHTAAAGPGFQQSIVFHQRTGN